jgi:hypothetical protein
MVFNLVNRVAPIPIVHLDPRGLLLTCSTTLPVRAGDEIYPPKGGGFNLAYGNKMSTITQKMPKLELKFCCFLLNHEIDNFCNWPVFHQ